MDGHASQTQWYTYLRVNWPIGKGDELPAYVPVEYGTFTFTCMSQEQFCSRVNVYKNDYFAHSHLK